MDKCGKIGRGGRLKRCATLLRVQDGERTMSRLLVTQYQTEVEQIIRYGGSRQEGSISDAFGKLLNNYCKPRNYLLVRQLEYKTRLNTTVRPDGTIKDAMGACHLCDE